MPLGREEEKARLPPPTPKHLHGIQMCVFTLSLSIIINRHVGAMDGPTDRQMDKPSYRVPGARLKRSNNNNAVFHYMAFTRGQKNITLS